MILGGVVDGGRAANKGASALFVIDGRHTVGVACQEVVGVLVGSVGGVERGDIALSETIRELVLASCGVDVTGELDDRSLVERSSMSGLACRFLGRTTLATRGFAGVGGSSVATVVGDEIGAVNAVLLGVDVRVGGAAVGLTSVAALLWWKQVRWGEQCAQEQRGPQSQDSLQRLHDHDHVRGPGADQQ